MRAKPAKKIGCVHHDCAACKKAARRLAKMRGALETIQRGLNCGGIKAKPLITFRGGAPAEMVYVEDIVKAALK